MHYFFDKHTHTYIYISQSHRVINQNSPELDQALISLINLLPQLIQMLSLAGSTLELLYNRITRCNYNKTA